MVTSITSGRLVVFKKTVWVGIKSKHEKKCSSHADVMGKAPNILYDVRVVVVLDDVFDPLVAYKDNVDIEVLADDWIEFGQC